MLEDVVCKNMTAVANCIFMHTNGYLNKLWKCNYRENNVYIYDVLEKNRQGNKSLPIFSTY